MNNKRIFVDFETNSQATERMLTKVHCMGYKLSDRDEAHVVTDSFGDVLNGFISIGYVPVFHNASFDLWVARECGAKIGVFHDTMLIHYLLKPYDSHSLANIGESLGIEKLDFTDFDSGYTEEMGTYCKRDVEICEKIFARFFPMLLSDSTLFRYYLNVELPMVNCIIDMETSGVAIDIDNWEAINREITEQRQQLEAQILDEYPFICTGKKSKTKNPRPDEQVSDKPELGKKYLIKKDDTWYHWADWETFNPSSNTHVKEVFGRLGYELNKTDKETLKNLGHPLAKLILEYRKVSKLEGTYGQSMLEKARDGRLHGSFNQCVTLTGRLSSSSPNLQNIPSRGETGDMLRKLFVAEKGNKLVSIDIDQFQLRIYAWYLHEMCPTMDDAHKMWDDFNNNPDCDPHQAKADMMGVSRSIGKTLNFATLFGASPKKAAQTAGCTVEEMKGYYELQDEQFPSDGELKRLVWTYCKRNNGVCYDLYGKRGYYPDILSNDWGLKGRAERQAFNFVVQGTEASIIKCMFIEACERLRGTAKPVLQVHDEFTFECSEKDAKTVAETLNDIVNRETWLPYLKVTGTASIGDNWYEVH